MNGSREYCVVYCVVLFNKANTCLSMSADSALQLLLHSADKIYVEEDCSLLFPVQTNVLT
jgi:hypothetical protein